MKVAVVRTEEGNLRLAIDAPREIEIVRGEVYEKRGK
ncbi:carbon storage regulator [Clostridium botulinum]|nr:carbon storage regulator [Clostridium botulinum]